MSKKFEVDIIKLEYPHNVRQKMGMFGCDGTNADILFRELVDNTVDLATKFKLSIDVKSWINQNDWNAVLDNGLGFPIYKDMDYPEEDVCIVRDMMRKINVGSNFHQTEYSSGQNGVGSRLTQAISEDFILISNATKKDSSTLPKFIQEGLKAGKSIYVWHSKKGLAFNETVMSKQEFVEYCKELIGDKITKNLNQFLEEIDEKEFGTMVMFKPDAELLDSTKVSYKGYPFAIIKSLFQYDSDFKDIKLNFELNGKEIKPYEFTQDFKDNLIHDKIFTCAVSVKTEDVKPIKFIFQTAWTSDKFNTEVNGSVNLLETPAGKHLNIIQTAIGQSFVKYNSLLKYQDSRYGLRLFVLNMALKPLFNSQDKTKLSKWEDKGYDERATIQAISDAFYKVMKNNTEFFDVLCARILEYKRATEKLSNIELLKSKIVLGDEGDKRRIQSGEMSKVYECTSNESSKRELYIVEGLSACFTGETEILDVNFNRLSMIDLVERQKQNIPTYTFSCSPEGVISVSKVINAFETKRVNKLLRVTLDNDSYVECTPEHLFMTRSGEWKQAKDLIQGESLMPIYYNKPVDNYGYVRHNTRKGMRYNAEKHYLDRNSGFLYEKVYCLSKKHEDTEISDSVKSGETCYQIQVHHKDFKKPKPNPFLQENNHKVVSITEIEVEDEPVYDITVDSEYHNFPLACGVFVHNCAGVLTNRDKRFQSILPLTN